MKANKDLKVYVLGSNYFIPEMVKCSEDLRSLGYAGWIHPDYEAFNKGEKQDIIKRAMNGEAAEMKIANHYLKQHYQHILDSDVILFVNGEKRGIKNYIGGNVLMEMSQAYVNDRKIFLLYSIPEQSAYLDEIKAMQPICLNGDLSNIKKYI